jgi:carnitine 3-dehydrogenase
MQTPLPEAPQTSMTTELPAAPASAPLRLLDGRVEAAWIDYNGHMTESRYLQVFSHASDALLAMIGAGPAYVARGHSYYTAETHMLHLRELRRGAAFYVAGQALGADAKRLHIFQVLHRAADGMPAATCEQMLLHVDAKAGRACPALPELRARLDALVAAHAALPRPAQAGRAIRLG